MRPTALPASLDGLRLRAELAAATRSGWASSSARQAGLAKLKKYTEDGKALAVSRLSGRSGGLEAARTWSGVMNALLRALFDSILADFYEDDAQSSGIVLCAVGGYGAGELAPQSDIDLVFLTSQTPPDNYQTVVERTLYALWDIGLPVGGGAIRTLDEAIALAREDVSERTALLDLRPVAGDASLAGQLKERFEKEICELDAPGFIQAKLAERDARVDRQGDSRYAVEPNIKDGKGALRDLQTLRWLAQVLYGSDALERWVLSGFLSVKDVERYLAAEDFFWTIRFHLHQLVGRKDDRLTFDRQTEIAHAMGYEDGNESLGVENFMRDYFRRAIDVGALTRMVCAKLEADELKDTPSMGGRFLPSSGEAEDDEALTEAGFVIRSGRLDFANPVTVHEDPVMMLRLFELAAARHLDLHPDAVSMISHNLSLINDRVRSNSRAVASFFAILLEADEPRLTLRAMTESGLLGAFIPEFGGIVARTQFNMYHRFTVDEHTLNAVGILRAIENEQLTEDHPLATKLVKQVHYRRALHLAVLLHDTGKGMGDQCIEGANNAMTACMRMGLDTKETELVAWLVRHHLDMNDVAQRRDISDARTVLDFAETVGTLERLRLLTILTVVDTRAVGPGVWNGWKAQLIRDLFHATEAMLQGGGRTDETESRARLRDRASQSRDLFLVKANRIDADFARRWTEELDDTYWLSFSEQDRLRHAAFVRSAENYDREIACGVRIDKRRAAAEVLLLAPDRIGLFSDITGIVASRGGSVVGAQVNTTAGRRAFDVLYVQERGGKAYGWSDPSQLEDLQDAILEAARAGLKDTDTIAPVHIRRREAAFDVTPYVTIDTDAADNALVIEASGRDRRGLLHYLSRALSDLGLSIRAARIDGYGERAVDVFYVTLDNAAPEDPALIETIQTRLLQVLQEQEDVHRSRVDMEGLTSVTASARR